MAALLGYQGTGDPLPGVLKDGKVSLKEGTDLYFSF